LSSRWSQIGFAFTARQLGWNCHHRSCHTTPNTLQHGINDQRLAWTLLASLKGLVFFFIQLPSKNADDFMQLLSFRCKIKGWQDAP